MSDQEMQFADPDWKPTQPLQKKMSTQTPEAYTPRPINEDIREQPQQPIRGIPSEQQGGYAGLPPYAGTMSAQPGERYQYRRPYRRRGRGLWFWIILAILLFSFMGGGLGALGRIGQKTLADDRSINVGSNTPTIVIHENNGNIHVQQGGTDTVHIDATKETGFFDDPRNIHVNVNQDPTNANIINVTVDTGNNNAFSSRQVDINVTVPQGANLQLVTTSGDISVDGINGQASLTTTSGNISASNDIFSANAMLKTTSGNIQASDDTFSGTSTISATSGDVSMEQDILNGQSNVTTTSGNIHFNGAVTSGQTYKFQADSGNVDIGLPGSSNFSVDGSTNSGSINSDDFPGLNGQPNDSGSPGQISGQVGTAPGASFTIHTGSGDINIHQDS